MRVNKNKINAKKKYHISIRLYSNNYDVKLFRITDLIFNNWGFFNCF